MKKNQEWESWKRKYNITHWKPAKSSGNSLHAAKKNAAQSSPSSGSKVGKKRGPKAGKLRGKPGRKSNAEAVGKPQLLEFVSEAVQHDIQ